MKLFSHMRKSPLPPDVVLKRIIYAVRASLSKPLAPEEILDKLPSKLKASVFKRQML